MPRWGRDRARRRSTLLAGALALGLLAGCGGSGSKPPTLPTDTSIALSGETLVPASGGLCDLKGVIQNLSVVQVNAVLQWQALDATGKELGTTSLTISDLNPGETRPFLATGFVSSDSLVACSKIVTFPLKNSTVTKS